MDVLVLADQQRLIHIITERTQDAVKRTCLVQLMIGIDGERKSWNPMPPVCLSDDDDE